MLKRLKRLILWFTVFFFVPTSFAYAAACFERSALMKHLEGKFRERPVAAGLAANGSVLEVLSSEEGKTWTVVLTQPNGATCVMASGESWLRRIAPKAGKASAMLMALGVSLFGGLSNVATI